MEPIANRLSSSFLVDEVEREKSTKFPTEISVGFPSLESGQQLLHFDLVGVMVKKCTIGTVTSNVWGNEVGSRIESPGLISTQMFFFSGSQ